MCNVHYQTDQKSSDGEALEELRIDAEIQAEAPPAPDQSTARKREPRDWWETTTGEATRVWLLAWGAVVRVRAVTGDAAAIPAPDGLAGSNRSAPSNVADVLLRYAEVDAFARQVGTNRLRELLAFIYVKGVEEREIGRTYILSDGSRLFRKAGEEEPGRWSSVEPRIVRELAYDLFEFAAPEILPVCEMWKMTTEEFLEREHLRFARRFAKAKGL